jgi:hypothetical protein
MRSIRFHEMKFQKLFKLPASNYVQKIRGKVGQSLFVSRL